MLLCISAAKTFFCPGIVSERSTLGFTMCNPCPRLFFILNGSNSIVVLILVCINILF